MTVCTAPAVDDDAVEYVEYTFPYYDVDPGQELWNNKPTYEQDVRWYESYSELPIILVEILELSRTFSTDDGAI